MTLPYERTNSVKQARDFLRDLLDPKKTPRIPKEIRKRAYWALRHFPSDLDMGYAADGAPSIFSMPERDSRDDLFSPPLTKSSRRSKKL